jgi:hypothetical protein
MLGQLPAPFSILSLVPHRPAPASAVARLDKRRHHGNNIAASGMDRGLALRDFVVLSRVPGPYTSLARDRRA